MKTVKKTLWFFIALVLFVIAWTVLLLYVSPEEIVSNLGISNALIIIFLIAVFGGVSTVTGSSFFLAVVTFAEGGVDPIHLALVGGFGIFLSDSFFFYLANKGMKAFKNRASKASKWILKKTKKWPNWLKYTVIYCYLGLTPLPNDVLMVAVALAKIKYRALAPILLVASFTIVLMTIYIGSNIFMRFLAML